jgi:peptidoglycan lytic transglycosylase G
VAQRREELTEPQPPVRRHRGPTQGQIMVRRVAALTLVAAVLAALGWGAAIAFDKVRNRGAASAPTVAPPPPKPFRIVFPEGFTRAQMAARITSVDRIAHRERGVKPRLNAKRYLALTARSRLPAGFARDHRRLSLEGFLFPATYDFVRATTTKQLVAKQLQAFKRNWSRVDLRYARSKNLTRYDVLIIASMIEKEAIAPDDRPKIAAVIYNRLHAGMPLGIDATIRYALSVPGTEPLHQSQLRNPTPYNTRIYKGLPPGPIANPGLASMQAAAHPTRANWLYFVRKPDKVHHFFTASYAAFQNYANAHGY